MIELRRLRAFVTVVEEGNITRAAERLFIQQPPLTRLLQGLEDELGVKLLQRLPRGVRVTEAGGVLFEEARALLARAERLREAVQRAARGEQGHIAIGFTSSAALHPFVPNLLRRYRDILPGITTQLEEAGSGELMDALLEQRLDAAFVRSPANGIPGLSVEPVLSEPMIVALPLGHRLAQERSNRCRWPNWPTSRLFSIAARPARGCTTPSWPPATAPASARASCRKRRACRPPSAWSAPD